MSKESHGMKSYNTERYDTHRKTQFEDGELVLTPQYIILYSSDGNTELKRILLSTITSCKYNRLRRHLEIKAVRGGDMQRKKGLMRMQDEMRDLYNRKIRYQGSLEYAGQKERSELAEKIEWVEQRAKRLHDEINNKKTAQPKGSETTETFRLPDSFGKDGWSAGDEYAVWEHIIRRKTQSTPRLRIESSPTGCVVAIENVIVGTTPLSMDAPLLDESIVRGKYHVTLLSENHKKEEFYIPADLVHHAVHTKMTGSSDTDSSIAEPPSAVRHLVSWEYLDDQRTDIHHALDGRDGTTMVLTDDGILTVVTNDGSILYNISYEHTTVVEHKKGFGSTSHIRITYDDPPFFGLKMEFAAKSDVAPREMERIHQFTVEKIANLKKYRLVTLSPTPKEKWWERSAPPTRKAPRPQETSIRSPSPSNLLVTLRRRMKQGDRQRTDDRRKGRVTQTDIDNKFVNYSPIEFEGLIAVLFRAKGYRAFVTKASQDGGIDVVASRGSMKTVVQVKKWNSNVGGPDVLKTMGACTTYRAKRAIVISTSGFTRQALEFESKNRDLELWDWDRIKSEFCRHIVEKPSGRHAGQSRAHVGGGGTNRDRKRHVPKRTPNKNTGQRNRRYRKQHTRRPGNKGRR